MSGLAVRAAGELFYCLKFCGVVFFTYGAAFYGFAEFGGDIAHPEMAHALMFIGGSFGFAGIFLSRMLETGSGLGSLIGVGGLLAASVGVLLGVGAGLALYGDPNDLYLGVGMIAAGACLLFLPRVLQSGSRGGSHG